MRHAFFDGTWRRTGLREVVLKIEGIRRGIHVGHGPELLLHISRVLMLSEVELKRSLHPRRGAGHLAEGEVVSLEPLLVIDDAGDERVADDVR